MTITAAADGSALGNPGPAGWGWYVDADRWACGGWPHGTNNIGELTAVLDLLQQSAALEDDLVILCDSTYVINSVTKWMPGWKRKNWRKGDGKPVQNVELMKALDAAMAGRRVRFEWVKGHAGHELNEQADRLANGAAVAYRNGAAPDPGPGFGAGDDRTDAHAGYRPTPKPEPEADLFSTVAEDSEISDEERVAALESELRAGRDAGDDSAVAALLHPDWQVIDESGRLLSRDDSLALPRSGPARTAEVVQIVRLGPGQMLLITRTSGDDGSGLASSCWVLDGGHWRQRFVQLTPEL